MVPMHLFSELRLSPQIKILQSGTFTRKVAKAAHTQTLYEQFVETQIPHGRSIFGLFPSTEQSRADFDRWMAAGRPEDFNL